MNAAHDQTDEAASARDPALQWLAALTAAGETESVWGTSPIRTRSYVSSVTPLAELVTSVRCIVLRGAVGGELDEVLVMRNRDGRHIWPGGRREGDETPEQTIHRELMEEAGCTVDTPGYLGFLHLRHLGPKPEGHRYLHPDFFHLVYTALAVHHDPSARLQDDYELGSSFEPLDQVRRELTTLGEPAFLDAALRALLTGR